MTDTLTQHAQEMMRRTSPIQAHFRQVGSNRYHPDTNPKGVVDLGLAENKICADLWVEKMSSIAREPEEEDLLYYKKTTGDLSFKQSMKTFLEKRFHLREELNSDNLVITNGVTVILEALTFAFAEPGEYMMVPTPYYYRIRNDLFERPAVQVVEFPLVYSKPEGQGTLQLDATVMETAYQRAVSEGKRVKAVMIVNPTNPSGDVFDAAQLTELLDFANRHKLHVICNEIYGLSIFDPDVKFTSILSLPHPDPERVHFAWGVSKDFGLSGYRCAVLYTRNPGLTQYLALTAIYFRATGLIQKRLKSVIEDDEWLDNVFFPTMKQRMRKRFQEIREALGKYGVPVHPGPATIFLWINLSGFLSSKTFEGEDRLFHQLLEGGVFFVPGRDFYHDEPGWFRIVCSVNEAVYREGMKRLLAVLDNIQQQRQ